jgi:hypothetical protein
MTVDRAPRRLVK